MAPGPGSPNSNRLVVNLISRVSELEERIRFLEYFMNLDEDAIKGAMEEKGEPLDEEGFEEELENGNVRHNTM